MYILPKRLRDLKGVGCLRAVVSRVSLASVEVEGVVTGKIDNGFLVLLGIKNGDTEEDAAKLAAKICNLRVFNDMDGKMNLNLKTAGGEILVISQFTLYADCRSRRPSFIEAARPETAIPLYEMFIEECKKAGFTVESGVFGAMMKVSSVNDGPVTIIVES